MKEEFEEKNNLNDQLQKESKLSSPFSSGFSNSQSLR